MKLLIILITANLFCCKQNPPPQPVVVDTSPVVWKKAFEKTDLSSTPIYFDGLIIIGHRSIKDGYIVYAHDAESGDSVWQTKINASGAFYPLNDEHTFLYEDKVIFSNGYTFFVLNAKTGSLIWHKRIEKMRGGSCVIDGYVYKANYVNQITSSLFRYDINTGAEDKLFTIDKSDYGSNYSPCLNMPVKWIDPNGNEILIMQNRTFGWYTNNDSKMDILAYNLTADSMLWYRDGLDTYSSVSRPAISGNKVYFYGYVHAYCIDAATGKTLWKYTDKSDDNGDFIMANILLIDNKLIVKPDGDWMHAVDKETGDRIWLNKETQSMPGVLTVHKDTIWFSSGWVLAIDALTGEKLIEWDNNDQGSWIFPVAHHPTKSLIYTSDATYLYCLDIKKMKE